MKFIDYQSIAASTCLPESYYPEYLRPELLCEAGEISGQISKIVRKDHDIDVACPLIAKEIGDVLWTASMWALLKGINVEGLALVRYSAYPPNISISYMEEVAADIMIDASIFRMTPSRTQLEALLRRLEILANAIGYSMHQIALMNQDKLSWRKEEGKIQGAGDVR